MLNYKLWLAILVAYGVVFLLIGALIFWKRSEEPNTMLISFMIIYLGVMLISTADEPLPRLHPESTGILSLVDFMGVTAIVLVLLTFPDGKLIGKWMSRI